MKIVLNPRDEAVAKSFIYNLFRCGGYSTLVGSCRLPGVYIASSDASPICEEIVNRQANFIKNRLDTHLSEIATTYFFYGPRSASGRLYCNNRRSAEQLATYIAWFCQNNDLKWDDSILTTYEMDALKQTMLGKTLYDAGCFNSFGGTQAPQAAAQTTPISTRTPGQPPKNGYKSSGAHSQDIPNLIGQAHNKVNLSGHVYTIIADKTGKNTPCAYITPLKADGSQVSKSAAEKVKFGSGNGYTDCALFFENPSDANKAEQWCKNNFSNANIRVVMVKMADKNGYFEVSTELGNAYIKANVLNEELVEDIEEPNTKSYKNSSENFKITDADLYAEWMHNSIS